MSFLPVFKNNDYNNSLREKGYIILPFLKKAELEKLNSVFYDFVPQSTDRFFATTHSPDLNLRKSANQAIQEAIKEPISLYFSDGKPLGGAFITKPVGNKGILPLHQDWNIVDETKFRSYNIWIPLVDVNEHNGAVFVLESSHNKTTSYRGPGIASPFSQITDEVMKAMTCLNMKAGEALIYDHALWHLSPENKSNQNRPAMVLGMIPRLAEMRSYYQEGTEIAEY